MKNINYKIILVLLIYIFGACLTNGYERFSRETSMLVDLVLIHKKGVQEDKTKYKSNLNLKESSFLFFNRIEGVFFIEDNEVCFEGINIKQKSNSYKMSAKYKNEKYDLKITINWHDFGADCFGVLYNKSNNDEIKFFIK